MISFRPLRAAVLGLGSVALVAGVAGCGSATDKLAEKAAEKATEQALESAGGGDVDIDTDGGLSFKTDEGSFELNEDGSYTMTDAEGGEITSGASSELPDGWPSNVELLEGAKIVSATTNSTDGAAYMSVSANFTGDLKDAHEAVKEQLEEAGFEIEGESITSSTDGGYGSVQATDGELQVGVTLMGAEDDDSLISYSVQEVEQQ